MANSSIDLNSKRSPNVVTVIMYCAHTHCWRILFPEVVYPFPPSLPPFLKLNNLSTLDLFSCRFSSRTYTIICLLSHWERLFQVLKQYTCFSDTMIGHYVQMNTELEVFAYYLQDFSISSLTLTYIIVKYILLEKPHF